MQAIAENGLTLAGFTLQGMEIILILGVVLILLGGKNLADLGRGLGRGLFYFHRATKKAADEMDDEANEAGRSLGGIYGKPAAEALMTDNQVAEVYDRALFEGPRKSRKTWSAVTGFLKRLWCWLRRCV